MNKLFFSVGFLLLLLAITTSVNCLGEVIFAVNCGGDALTDSHGIRYKKDYLTDGVASDYGRGLDIKRVPQQDKPLYQHERYSANTFGYLVDIPASDADYVLWLKFSEVWFNAPHQKIFDISLNEVIVINELDIFARVGRGIAHDEIVPFQVRKGKIIINGKAQPLVNNELKIEFIKGQQDNPKINAIVVMKGTPDQVPALMPYEPPVVEKSMDDEDEDDYMKKMPNLNEEGDHEEEEEDMEQRRLRREKQRLLNERLTRNENDDEQEEQEENNNNRKQRRSSQKMPKTETDIIDDPYAADESSYLIPILVAIGAFIPLLFCLCKI